MMIAILVALAALPATGSRSPATPSRAEQVIVDAAGTRGRAIYDFDQAAWATTDVLVSRLSGAQLSTIKGWVVEAGSDGAQIVTYFTGDAGGRKPVFVATTRDKQVVESHAVPADTPADLTPAQVRLASAVDVARKYAVDHEYAPCGAAPFNTVAVPDDTVGGSTSIYLLTPQTEANNYPFGGHFRIDVGSDGKVSSARAFTKSCLLIDPQIDAVSGKPAMLIITHLLDPVPTEIHAFMSLWTGLPLMVATANSRAWIVNGAAISQSSLNVPTGAEH